MCAACYKRSHTTEESKAKAREYAKAKYAENPEKYRNKQSKWAEANPEKVGAWARDNPELAKASQDAWRAANPDYARKQHLKKKYGMPIHEFERLEAAQSGLCLVCGCPCSVRSHLSVDHCHLTNKVRGLLCHGCNVSIGFCKNDPALLRKLADYLDRHNEAAAFVQRLLASNVT